MTQFKGTGTGIAIALLLLGAGGACGTVIQEPGDTHEDDTDASRQSGTSSDNERSARLRQLAALNRGARLQVSYSTRGSVRLLEGDTGISVDGVDRLQRGEPAPRILDRLRDVLLAEGTEQLVVDRNQVTLGLRSLFLTESIRGIPVIHGGISVGIDSATNTINILKSYFVPDRGLPRTPLILAETSMTLASAFIASRDDVDSTTAPQIQNKPSLAYYGGNRDTGTETATLVWVMNVTFNSRDRGSTLEEILLDAVDGSIRSAQPSRVAALSRTVYSANNTAPLPQNFNTSLPLLWGEGAPNPAEVLAYSAYQHVQTTYSTWRDLFGHEPSKPVGIVVHYGTSWTAFSSNAPGKYWLAFSDGDAARIAPSADLDSVAHEYGHTVFEQHVTGGVTAGWTDDDAIDEGYGDFSAVLTDEDDRGFTPGMWEIAPVKLGSAPLRSWSNPRSASPVAMDWYQDRLVAPDPHNALHILGHAFYLMTVGGNHVRVGGAISSGSIPFVTVPALVPSVPPTDQRVESYHRARNIFFAALNHPRMLAFPQYPDLKAATEWAALQLYGVAAKDSVTLAWAAVGVGYSCTAPPQKPVLQVDDFMCRGRYEIFWDPVSGANRYFAQAVPEFYPWSLSTPIVDGTFTHCFQEVRQRTWVRLQACNGCGCSEFTEPRTLTYWPGPCS